MAKKEKKKIMTNDTTKDIKLIFSDDFKQDTFKIIEITKELADELEENKKDTKYYAHL
ncbi:hypothetical protein PIROE2DRAFT_17185 [Piromyces sp. E2]|nr:hypothetical protein PIROE2DRAFT_17185 [Piromyces sp. E2]|eukprot:OUM57731.1 hypothetical protein PIROE2DRAFT_17185 [Piromyces sp. E2]